MSLGTVSSCFYVHGLSFVSPGEGCYYGAVVGKGAPHVVDFGEHAVACWS